MRAWRHGWKVSAGRGAPSEALDFVLKVVGLLTGQLARDYMAQICTFFIFAGSLEALRPSQHMVGLSSPVAFPFFVPKHLMS